MRAFLDRLTFDQLLALTVVAAVAAVGMVGGAVCWWVYDQAGD